MGSSRTRARTRVPCIGRQILNHCVTREALASFNVAVFLETAEPMSDDNQSFQTFSSSCINSGKSGFCFFRNWPVHSNVLICWYKAVHKVLLFLLSKCFLFISSIWNFWGIFFPWSFFAEGFSFFLEWLFKSQDGIGGVDLFYCHFWLSGARPSANRPQCGTSSTKRWMKSQGEFTQQMIEID